MPIRSLMAKSDSQSSLSSHLLPRNVVVAGETGVGKSSFINLVTGSDTAITANGVCGVTTCAEYHSWETETQAFRLWDTPGLSEGSFGSVSHKTAQNGLRSLLKQLTKEGGVHLLVLCMRGITHVTKGMKQTYDVILRIRDEVSPQIPVVAVITELEKRCNQANMIVSMEEWWTSNERALAGFSMTFCGHACLTTLTDECHPRMSGRHAECQQLARNLLMDRSLPLVAFGASMRTTNALSRLSLKLTRNIVVVGETGVGKSSFINLVTGLDTATTANDVRGVTTSMSWHAWETESQMHAFRLWDTPGLDEHSFGNVSPKAAQHALRLLLRDLMKEGGVHLVVVCMRGVAQITPRMKQLYDAILRIRDQVSSQIPVVAVITELEKLCDEANGISSMEQWWTNNERALADLGMAFCGHACLTNLHDDCHPPMSGRHAECQRLARNLLIDRSLPFVAFGGFPSSVSLKLTRNVVIVGETGVGKSSTINLVIGTDSAFAANNVRAVTVSTSYHDWNLLQNQTFRLWDTPGLGEGPFGSTPPGHAHNAVRSLLTELGRRAGVHLLVVCLRGDRRVTKSMKQTYDMILTLRDRVCPDAPLVAVITGLERNSKTTDVLAAMDQWWHTNADIMSDSHMKFTAHSCITTLSDDAHPPIPGRRDDCQRLVRDLIIDHALTARSVPAQDLHVILFGETGVGKSSLVNLLAGWHVAEVSPDSVACTLASTEYQFQLGAATIRLWDTIGLKEPEDGTSGYTGAVEKAAELIRRLSTSGGISLFLFCIRGKRVTMAMQRNYRLFYEVLGKKQVPIALVVTNLEQEPVMEDWWLRNAKTLEMHGIHASGHVCITTLEGDPKCVESRNAVQDLLGRYADQGKFSMPSELWLIRLLNGLNALLGFGLPRGKELVRTLTKRCHLEPEVAQKVAACIESTMNSSRLARSISL